MPLSATRITLRHLARRHLGLTEEIGESDGQIAPLAAAAAPQLPDLFGVGPEIAGQLLTTAGDNPERLPSEAVFRALMWHRADPGLLRQNPPAPPEPRR
jgi:transposase